MPTRQEPPCWLEEARSLRAEGIGVPTIVRRLNREDATANRIYYWLDRDARLDDAKATTRTQYVYFIQGGEGGPIKIGTGNNLRVRLKHLQIGNPQKLRVTHKIAMPSRKEAFALEKQLHAEFAVWRLEGEWFEPVPELAVLAKAQSAHGDRKTMLRNALRRAYLTGYTDGQNNEPARQFKVAPG